MKPLPLEQLLGGPLRALVLAQGLAEQATAQYISQIGFLPAAAGGEDPHARTISFSYRHPVPDPNNPGAVLETPVRLTVPVLALTNVPQLRVAEANITLAANIVEVTAGKPAEGVLTGAANAIMATPISVTAVYAATPQVGGTTPGLSVSIRVEKEPPAEGLARVLALLQDSINTEPVKR